MTEEEKFLKQFEEMEIDWGAFEEGFYFAREREVELSHDVQDGYIDVELVFSANSRFFRTYFSLVGKDLDEVYEEPVFSEIEEVYPVEVTTIKYV